ncbi:MAG: ATP synthase F1 subunit gamma [Ignavibacteria bacterium]|nr:ATP synthase F1 subunit gamma [Ignavibacteria bacterium]
MATLREVRRRIVSVKSTQKITKAMKMVAAAKMRRAQDAIIAARPYSKKMKEMLLQVSSQQAETSNPFFTVRPIERAAFVIVSADRGLCGAFNSNLIKTATQHIEKKYGAIHSAGNLLLYCVGKKSFDFFSKRNYEIAGKQIGMFNNLQFSNALSLSEELTQGFLCGEFDSVEIIYNEFKSVISQKTVFEQFLPLVPLDATSERSQSNDSYIYEPTKTRILDTLIPQHLNFQIWRILLESNASEQAARMTAMENATNNASDLISSLQLSYNKARQAAITKEILEIVGGAEALAQAG